uniref:Putative CDP-alcohol phosphatidyltransferase class-I family protein 3 n=1 Tax=Aegilops tauschii TaxID=37682 RepID=N1R2U2_AEGTA
MGYVGSHGVATLRKYKYSGVDHSIVAKYILQPFWSRFVNVFPLWFPPNMLYSPHLDTAPPRWVHLAHGILLFLYQTFDAVDGKQARRTNSSSPLGELFDHGCDALACTFESLAFGSTAMCGNATFWFWVISAVPFYFATWEHYFTNTLVLPIVNGPTEGLMLIYVCHIFTFFTGAEWWAQDFRKSVPLLNWVPLVPEISLYGIVLFLMIAFAVIPTIGSKSYLSPSDIMRNQPHLLIIGTGFAFGYLVGRMILAHLCDEPKVSFMEPMPALAYFPFAIANALTAQLDDGNPLFDEQLVLLIYCLFTVALYMHFATSVIHEITNALGIHCFRITRKKA